MKKKSIIASTLIFLSTLLNADIVIKNGWQLLGATQDINTSIFNNTCVDYIWKYDSTDIDNTEWKIHVANEVEYNHNMTPITSLTKGEGYWVKGNADCNVTLERYSRSASGVVTDHDTYLQWQDDTTAYFAPRIYAGVYCYALELDGVGWRLPSRYELVSIVEDTHEAPIINPVFENTTSDYYWSSTNPSALFTYNARIVSFAANIQSIKGWEEAYYVRCVRARQ